MYHETFVLEGLQDLPHVDYVLLVAPAADDDVVHACKSCLAVHDGPVHMALE
jgi:hypothetical protein